jgi:hypothetical protein
MPAIHRYTNSTTAERRTTPGEDEHEIADHDQVRQSTSGFADTANDVPTTGRIRD